MDEQGKGSECRRHGHGAGRAEGTRQHLICESAALCGSLMQRASSFAVQNACDHGAQRRTCTAERAARRRRGAQLKRRLAAPLRAWERSTAADAPQRLMTVQWTTATGA